MPTQQQPGPPQPGPPQQGQQIGQTPQQQQQPGEAPLAPGAADSDRRPFSDWASI